MDNDKKFIFTTTDLQKLISARLHLSHNFHCLNRDCRIQRNKLKQANGKLCSTLKEISLLLQNQETKLQQISSVIGNICSCFDINFTMPPLDQTELYKAIENLEGIIRENSLSCDSDHSHQRIDFASSKKRKCPSTNSSESGFASHYDEKDDATCADSSVHPPLKIMRPISSPNTSFHTDRFLSNNFPSRSKESASNFSNISSSFASKNGVFKGFRSYPSQSYTPTPTSFVENAKSGAFLKRQSHSRINANAQPTLATPSIGQSVPALPQMFQTTKLHDFKESNQASSRIISSKTESANKALRVTSEIKEIKAAAPLSLKNLDEKAVQRKLANSSQSFRFKSPNRKGQQIDPSTPVSNSTAKVIDVIELD